MAVAVISGTALAPGVSRNRRLYTPKNIASALARMQERIKDDDRPIVMRTHHGAGDDSRLIVGKVTAVDLDENGALKFESQLYGTQPGKDIAALVTGGDPVLRSVSISGGWLGGVRTVEYQGQTVETADELEIDAIDFTASPGVLGALIDRGSKMSTESAVVKYPISESYEATMTIADESPPGIEEADKTPYGSVTYADPGKQKDGVKRYPLDTEKHVRAAWSYINMPKNAAKYSPADLAAIKGKIKAAMKRMGIKAGNESAETRYSEVREYYPSGSEGNAGLCIDAYAGPLCITFRATCLDASSLKAVGAAAMAAATDALAALDPDTDGDIDVPGAPLEDDDNDMESATRESAVPETVKESIVGLRQKYLMDVAQVIVSRAPELTGRDVMPLVQGEALGETDAEDLVSRVARVLERRTMDDPMTADDDATESDPSHSHTHTMSEGHTHTHGHMHVHEAAEGDSYQHSHGHDHFHLSGGDESHSHTHNHSHATAPGDTHENATHEQESAVSETEKNPAAEAAPAQAAVTMETANALAQSMLALAQSQTVLAEAVAKLQTAPVAAVAPAAPEAPQEAAPAVPAPAQEAAPAAPAVTEAAPAPQPVDEAALAKRIRDDLRNEILKEYGIPQRTGYRMTQENADGAKTPEQEKAESWENRAALLLGTYGQTPVPMPGTGIAQGA